VRILVDALAPKVGGGRTYILNLLPELLKSDHENSYHLLVSEGQFPELENEPRLAVHSVKISLLPHRLAYQQSVIPFLVKRWKANVLFSTTDITTLAAPCKVVLAIHNPNPYQNPYPRTSIQHWRLRTLLQLSRLSVRKAAKVIFVSDYARALASEKLRCSAEKAAVVRHGVSQLYHQDPSQSEELDSKVDLPTERRYILFVSTLYLYKNPVRLVDAFARCCGRPGFDYDLVIAGRPVDSGTTTELHSRVESSGLAHRIHLLGEVAHTEMPALYRNASLFVFPSYSETFGLPLVEAMASGVPVVAANASSIPEVTRDAAIYFDPFDVEDMAEKIESVVYDPRLASSLRQRGLAQARQFSWKRSAEETAKVFRDAYGDSADGQHDGG